MTRKPKTSPVEWLYIPAFPIPIYAGKLLLCVTRDEWSSVAAVYDSDPDTEGCKGLAIRHLNAEGRTYVIGVFDGAVDTFVHELAHTVFHLLGDVGIPVESGEANEAFTYMLGHWMREIFPVFQATAKQPKLRS
ncbi:MAG TPA: hypothetical protein VF783_14055 [Terriglobales bacterium]